MNRLLTYLILLSVALAVVGCGNNPDVLSKDILSYPIKDTFEMYSRKHHPGPSETFYKEKIISTLKNDTVIEFWHYQDSTIGHKVKFTTSNDSFNIVATRYYEDDYCYETTGPFLIHLSDTSINIFKVELDCYGIIDEEGCTLYAQGVGAIARSSYAWGGKSIVDSLYNHPLSKYVQELRDSLLSGYSFLLRPNKPSGPPEIIEKPWGCSSTDILLLNKEVISKQFFNQQDSVRSFQYPNNDQEVNIMVDLTPEYLKEFLSDLDTKVLRETNRYEKEYHFNIAPKGFSDPKKCMDKIAIEYSSTDCSYRMVIYNTFLVEPDWCTESTVIYSFKIKNNTIIDFYRNEAG